jgi:hypothetical protein
MPAPVIPVVLSILGAGLFFLSKKGEGGGPTDAEKGVYLSRMGGTRPAGQPIAHSPAGTYLYQWAWGGKAGETTAREFIERSVKAGWIVWADMTLLGQDRFYLALARPGVSPQGSWFVLASGERDVDAMSIAPGGQSPPAGGTTIPVPIPTDAVAIQTPADAAKIPGVPGAPSPPAVPGVPSPAAPAATTGTGLPDVDAAMASPDSTPYMLRQVAAELRKSGKADAALMVERRANELYASLRASHALKGGTPFIIRDHHGGGVSGHLPANVASHYGGTLDQLGKANPGKKRWSDWKVGATWLLPLDWDVEAKPPPPIVGVTPKKPTLKAAKPGKVKRA